MGLDLLAVDAEVAGEAETAIQILAVASPERPLVSHPVRHFPPHLAREARSGSTNPLSLVFLHHPEEFRGRIPTENRNEGIHEETGMFFLQEDFCPHGGRSREILKIWGVPVNPDDSLGRDGAVDIANPVLPGEICWGGDRRVIALDSKCHRPLLSEDVRREGFSA